MAPEEGKKTYVCEKCGCEAELTVKEEKPEDLAKGQPKRGTLVCKVCGNEADIVLEEI